MKILSVVIPSQGEDSVLNLLSDLRPHDELIETIIVINPPNPYFEKIVATKFPSVKISTTQKGVNKARNLGLKLANYEWVYFLDSDIRINATHIKIVLDIIKKNYSADLIGGPYILPSNPSGLTLFYNQLQNNWIYSGYRHDNNWTFLLAGNLIVKKTNAEFFDEKITYGSSELSFLMKAMKNNKKIVFIPTLAVLHASKISFLNLTKKVFLQGFGASLNKFDFNPTFEVKFDLNGSDSLIKKWLKFCFRCGYALGRSDQSIVSSDKIIALSLVKGIFNGHLHPKPKKHSLTEELNALKKIL